MELVLKSAAIDLPQGIANLEALKAELAPKLEQYNSLVVTEDSIKEAKNDRAILNKLKATIEDQRKAAKKQYLEPYNMLEAECKEVVALIDAPIQAIDKQIKFFDDREKEEKLNKITDIFNNTPHEEWVSIEDVLPPKWANKTEKLDNIKNEIKASCEKFTSDYEQLNKLYDNFPHKIAILDRFKSTKDFSQTMVYAKNLEFEYSKEQQRKEQETNSAQNAPEGASESDSVITPPENENGHSVEYEKPQRLIVGTFEVMGTADQIKALGVYMREQKIRFKIVK